jgi:glycosyltransferase involved in cell wall biosynthesis
MSYHTDYCNYLKYHRLTALEPIAEAFFKQFYNRSDRTLVPSKFTLEQLRGKGYENLSIWSRGIDTEKFNPAYRSGLIRDKLGIGGRFAFLNVGRLSCEKGLDTLMYAIGRINEIYPGEAVFVITGEGPYEESIRKAGFGNVIMTGFKRGHELSEIYASCDCFAFPSASETFGNTGLEAMASGLAVAGINRGGVTEYLVHGYNGLISQNGDKDGFTRNLMELMKNKELRNRLSSNAVKTANARGWDRVSESLITEHKSAIAGNEAKANKRAS